MQEDFDVIIVGTGFASSFFLSAYQEKSGASARVLVLERGRKDSHAWRLQHRSPSSIAAESTFVNKNRAKQWFYTPGLGGGSNCWWAVTPRFMPADFAMRSQYGVGLDWPLSYDDLEEMWRYLPESLLDDG